MPPAQPSAIRRVEAEEMIGPVRRVRPPDFGESRDEPRKHGYARTAAVALLLSVVVDASAASAQGSRGVVDRDDTGGPLDLAAASVSVREARRSQNDKVIFTLRTFEAWTVDVLAERSFDPNFVGFEFVGTRGQGSCIQVTAGADGRLHARSRRPCIPLPSASVRELPIRVRRPNRKSVRFALARKELGRGKQRARTWRATSSFQRSGDEACPAPEYPPPEQLFARCVDRTRWAKLPQ